MATRKILLTDHQEQLVGEDIAEYLSLRASELTKKD